MYVCVLICIYIYIEINLHRFRYRYRYAYPCKSYGRTKRVLRKSGTKKGPRRDAIAMRGVYG